VPKRPKGETGSKICSAGLRVSKLNLEEHEYSAKDIRTIETQSPTVTNEVVENARKRAREFLKE
jgi:hypothetical protein